MNTDEEQMSSVQPIDYQRADLRTRYPLLKRLAISLACGAASLCMYAAERQLSIRALFFPCFLLTPVMLLTGLICGISGVYVAGRSERTIALASLTMSAAGVVGYLIWISRVQWTFG